MRLSLLYNPLLVAERLFEIISYQNRKLRLVNTPAYGLPKIQPSHLELLFLIRKEAAIHTIFDVGANVGTWTILAHSIFPDSKIIAFEPVPEYYNLLSSNIKKIYPASCENIALSDASGNYTFQLQGHSSSFLKVSKELLDTHPLEYNRGEILVQAMTLDEYIGMHHLSFPDIIKLDVEGFEISVMQGARNTLRSVSYIVLEVSFVERHLAQPLFHDVVAFMASQHFYLYAFPQGIHMGVPIKSCDVLFKKSQHSSSRSADRSNC
jgi:FkbM family methyltransferase